MTWPSLGDRDRSVLGDPSRGTSRAEERAEGPTRRAAGLRCGLLREATDGGTDGPPLGGR